MIITPLVISPASLPGSMRTPFIRIRPSFHTAVQFHGEHPMRFRFGSVTIDIKVAIAVQVAIGLA